VLPDRKTVPTPPAMPAATTEEEPRVSRAAAPQPRRQPERPRRRAEAFPVENQRASQHQSTYQDVPPNPAPTAEPAQPAPATVQAVVAADVASPAFWERRHLNHLRLRLLR
jgi:hypothetical protein